MKHMKISPAEENNTINRLRSMKTTGVRDADRSTRGKAAFLSQASQMRQAVPNRNQTRHSNWKGIFAPIRLPTGREGLSMVQIAMVIIMALGLLLGGSGVTAAAAQNSMPDDALYSVKLISERVRMQLANDPTEKYQLALQYANRRIEEAGYILGQGEAPNDALMMRLQEQVQQCLKLALGLPETEVEPALIQLQLQLQQQLRLMQQLNLQENGNLAQVRLRIQEQLRLDLEMTNLGLSDPLKLQEELHLRDRQQLEKPENDAEPNQEQNQYQQQNGGNGSNDMGGNQWMNGTATGGSGDPTVESQNPWTDETPTPGSSYGPGEPQNPWTDLTPTPGSGYGPGDGTCQTCTPNTGTQTGTGGNKP